MQIVNLDVMMARRKMSLNELFEKSKPDVVQPFNTEERERVLRLCNPSVKYWIASLTISSSLWPIKKSKPTDRFFFYFSPSFHSNEKIRFGSLFVNPPNMLQPQRVKKTNGSDTISRETCQKLK
jgi:hypothetical protein